MRGIVMKCTEEVYKLVLLILIIFWEKCKNFIKTLCVLESLLTSFNFSYNICLINRIIFHKLFQSI